MKAVAIYQQLGTSIGTSHRAEFYILRFVR